MPKHVRRAVLLVLVLASAPWTVFADEVDPAAAVQTATSALGSRDAEARIDALEHLERLLVEFPEHGPRCLARLRDILKRRGPDERARAMTVIALVPGRDALGLWF